MTDITELVQKPTRYGTNSQGVFTNQTDGAYVSYLSYVALVEALEKAQQERDEFRSRLKLERSILEDADKRIAELESQVKFPGVMRCNTCGFSRSHVIVTPGGMLVGESEPEHCPNGCGPLWHDTYRRQYNELYDAYKELESRSVTVKLSKDHVDDADLFGWGVIVVPLEALKEACADAGVTVEITDAGIKWEAE